MKMTHYDSELLTRTDVVKAGRLTNLLHGYLNKLLLHGWRIFVPKKVLADIPFENKCDTCVCLRYFFSIEYCILVSYGYHYMSFFYLF